MKASQMTEQPLSAYAKGVLGEAAACDFLERQGMLLLNRRYRAAGGEIDLILLDGDVLVFAEVKLRGRGTTLDGQYAVTPRKQRRMIAAARCFLGENPRYAHPMIRFDVVTVAGDGVTHLPNAFQGAEWE